MDALHLGRVHHVVLVALLLLFGDDALETAVDFSQTEVTGFKLIRLFLIEVVFIALFENVCAE